MLKRRIWTSGASGPLVLVTVVVALFCAMVIGCQNSGPIDVETASRVPVDLDKSNDERLLRYYLGGYVSPAGGDPVEAGLMFIEGGLALDPQMLDTSFRGALEDSDGNGKIGWDEFVAFIEATYAEARGLPQTLDEVRSNEPTPWGDSDSWFSVDVDGVMTEALRRVYVPLEALKAALGGYREADDQIIYDPGTLIVGEHRADDVVIETTIKRRRTDGFWDFAVYDAEGQLTSRTTTGPKELRSPEQCVGCHLGQRTFDPEKSFPGEAREGPNGPRAIYVEDNLRNAEVTALFNEHANRSDGVLGLYATLFTAQLIADREAGVISDQDAELLEGLGL